jgi:KipI family sensor histidine kinase inhibitor
MVIHSAGERALMVYLGEGMDPAVAGRVQALVEALPAALGEHLVDVVPSYASVLVVFDPFTTDHMHVIRELHRLGLALDASAAPPGRCVELPAWYAPESGADLVDLARRTELAVDEVIALHSGVEYRVYAIGFAPGFAYLGAVDERIAAPRLATPRQRVPRGAIAIADRQTAVYPAASPGGWNLIGRCPLRLFDPGAQPTMPVAVGDRVRFRPIDREEYLALGGEP